MSAVPRASARGTALGRLSGLLDGLTTGTAPNAGRAVRGPQTDRRSCTHDGRDRRELVASRGPLECRAGHGLIGEPPNRLSGPDRLVDIHRPSIRCRTGNHRQPHPQSRQPRGVPTAAGHVWRSPPERRLCRTAQLRRPGLGTGAVRQMVRHDQRPKADGHECFVFDHGSSAGVGDTGRRRHSAHRAPVHSLAAGAGIRYSGGLPRRSRPAVRGARLDHAVVIVLGAVCKGFALLSLGLVRPWGEVVPDWVPIVRGRRIPVLVAVVPAVAGAVALIFSSVVVDEPGEHRRHRWPYREGHSPDVPAAEEAIRYSDVRVNIAFLHSFAPP